MDTTAEQTLTPQQRWLSSRYLLYSVCSNLWFFSAVWLYLYRLFITDQQVGLLDGLAFAIGLVAEVPSGALADKFGRDKVVRLGLICIGGSILLQASGSSFAPFFVGQSIMSIGFALVSGADEALFFQKLNLRHDSTTWRKLVTRGSQLALTATLVATVIGAGLHAINPRLPWVLTALAFALATYFIWPVTDERPRKARGVPSQEIKEYLQDIKIGFAQFRLPKLRPYVPIIIFVRGIFYAMGYGLLRIILLDRFGFSPFLGGVVIALCGAITVGILAAVHKRADTLSEKRVLVYISLSAAAGLFLASANIGMWGFFVILALHAGEYTLKPFMSEALNRHAPEAQRATVLSVSSFLRTMPYVVLAPLIGSLNTHHQLHYFLSAWALLICVAVALYLVSRPRDTQIVAT